MSTYADHPEEFAELSALPEYQALTLLNQMLANFLLLRRLDGDDSPALEPFEPLNKADHPFYQQHPAILKEIDKIAGPVSIAWLWPTRLALGKFTLVDGDPDVGKSLIGLDNALRVAQGSTQWPADKAKPEQGRSSHDLGRRHALIFTSEDDWEDTILPRLIAAGATPEDLTYIHHNPCEFSIPDSLESLREVFGDLKPAYINLDPLEQYIAQKANGNQSKDIRQALSPFVELIREFMVAGWGVRHTNKVSGARALDKGSGSRQYGAIARINLMCGINPNNPSYRVLAKVKANLSPYVTGLSFWINETEQTVTDVITGQPIVQRYPFIVWDGISTVTADQIVAGPRQVTVAQDCAAYIESLLAEVGDMQSAELEANCFAHTYSDRAYRDGRKVLGDKLVSNQREDGKWWVALRSDDAPA